MKHLWRLILVRVFRRPRYYFVSDTCDWDRVTGEFRYYLMLYKEKPHEYTVGADVA